MHEITAERLQIAYLGPALQAGRMPMLALAAGMRGQALLIERTKTILYGEAVSIRIEVDTDFETGSLIVPVRIFADIQQARDLLAGPDATALANLIALLGFGTGVTLTLYKLFRRLKGRRIENPGDIQTDFGIEIAIDRLIRLYNDSEIQMQLRRTLEPLRQDGIEEFQTRRQGQPVEHVFKADVAAADEAEIKDNTKDEEVELGIEKSAWRRDLAWHFSDGQTSFDARIQDENFWKRIDGGEAFSEGDRLRVHLRTTAQRTSQGKLKVERSIPTVLRVDHMRTRQGRIFGDEVTGDEKS